MLFSENQLGSLNQLTNRVHAIDKLAGMKIDLPGDARIGVCFVLFALFFLMVATGFSQYPARPFSANHLQLQTTLARGWNTWSVRSVTSHVLLPEGLAINLGFHGSWKNYADRFFATDSRAHHLKLGLRTDDGRYTSLSLNWSGMEITIESATENENLVLLVTVPNGGETSHLVVEGGLLWNRPGSVQRQGDALVATLPQSQLSIRAVNPVRTDFNVPAINPYLTVALHEKEIGIYTGPPRDLAGIKQLMQSRRAEVVQRSQEFGELAPAFNAMQQVLSWNTIYDASQDRVITPVSRPWANGWGGWVLFDWDTYFAAYMFSLFNKNLAFANAIAITRSITKDGFIPNFASPGLKTDDRSQPPVGSMIVREIYRRHPEKWFLAEVYAELLSWNRWWPENRDKNGFLCWGSNPQPNDTSTNTYNAAILESGLDNSPMYDGVPYDAQAHVIELADVGLMSFYIADCQALAEIAQLLGHAADARELSQRATTYRQSLARLWHEPTGLYLNQRTDTGEFSQRLSPTHFYPLLTKLPTLQQATRMVNHFYNPAEFWGEWILPSIARNDPGFADNEYWRGRIWAPMNFLVYMGLQNYDLPQVRQDLAAKSLALLLHEWNTEGHVHENYNALTGDGDDVNSSDIYYHWGALLGFMALLEKGF